MARMTLEEIKARKPRIDRARLDATTEDDIRRYMSDDGQDPDAPLPPMETVWPPQAIRKRLGMTQERFAAALGIPLATLRNWEQGRTRPDPTARVLFRIIAKNPELALSALETA